MSKNEEPPCRTDGNYEVVRNISELLSTLTYVETTDTVLDMIDAVVDVMQKTKLAKLAHACPQCFGHHAFQEPHKPRRLRLVEEVRS